MSMAIPGFDGGVLSSGYSKDLIAGMSAQQQNDLAAMLTQADPDRSAVLPGGVVRIIARGRVIQGDAPIRVPVTTFCDYCGNAHEANRRVCWSCGAPKNKSGEPK